MLNHPHCDDRHHKSSTAAMVRELNWDTLLKRREKLKVSFMYKIEHDLVEIPPRFHLTPADARARLRCPHKLFLPCSNNLVHGGSFLPSAIKLEDSLPADVYTAPALDSMKERLRRTTL